MTDPLRRILDALTEAGCRPRGDGAKWSAMCPAHEDSTPSLSISRGEDGRVLVHCHAGCPYGQVMRALGLSSRDGFASTRSDGTPRQRGPRRSRWRQSPPVPSETWARMHDRFRSRITGEQIERLAEELGVAADALRALGIGYATQDDIDEHIGRPVARCDAYAFPMRDASGAITGINTRPVDGGRKMTMKGGRLGLFVPGDLASRDGTVLLVEGASDCAAALTAGYAAVGRPSAKPSRPVIEQHAALLEGREVVCVGENDRKKNGAWPGREGAEALARALGKAWNTEPPRLAMPPADCKDLREWLARHRHKDTTDGRRHDDRLAGDTEEARGLTRGPA